MNTRFGAVVLALCLILAGCAGPLGFDDAGSPVAETVSPSPTAEETPEETYPPGTYGKVTLEGGELAFDPELTYQRVAELYGVDYEDVPEVTVHVEESAADELYDQVWEPTEFMLLWGIDPAEQDRTEIAGLARGTDVFIYTDPLPEPEAQESVLAHEFVHTIQFDTEAGQRLATALQAEQNNAGQLGTAMIEGAAMYVQFAYERQYLDIDREWDSWEQARADRSTFGAWAIAPYYFGHEYVDARVDEPQEMDELYDDPPLSTEQLIHGSTPEEAPPRELTVTAETDDTWTPEHDQRVKGELFLRIVLEDRLHTDRAADAAAGWGADRVETFESTEGERGHAWTLRWDDPDEADEFEAAITDYLDRRGVTMDGMWVDYDDAFDVDRVDDDTVVVFGGDPAFVEAAEATGSDGEVTIQVGEVNGAASHPGAIAQPEATTHPGAIAQPEVTAHPGAIADQVAEPLTP